jgi:hypothetical protein
VVQRGEATCFIAHLLFLPRTVVDSTGMTYLKNNPLVLPVALAIVCAGLLVATFTDTANGRIYVTAAGAVGALLAAVVAIFKEQLVLAMNRPEIGLSYSHDTALQYAEVGWFLFITATNSSNNPLKDAVIKCVAVTPNAFPGVESAKVQPSTPIPFTWCYWDAFSKLYDDKKYALHRTLYDGELCDLLEITRADNGRDARVKLKLAVQPRGQDYMLEADKEYRITCKVYGDNFSPDKTWTFRVEWKGKFPEDYTELGNGFTIDLVTQT